MSQWILMPEHAWSERRGCHWLKPGGPLKAVVRDTDQTWGVSWMVFWNGQRVAGVDDVALSVEDAKAHAVIALNAFSAAWSDYNEPVDP